MDEKFFNECASAISAVVGTANGLPPHERPFLFMQNRDDHGFVFCFSDYWVKDMEGTWPVTSFSDCGYTRNASGFLLLHDMTVAEDAFMRILEEDGKRWSDLGLGKKSAVYMPEAIRDLVERRGVCDVERWDRAFQEARRLRRPTVSCFLKIEDNGDGTYSCEASARMESSISYKVNFKAASSDHVTSVDDVRELLQTALAEITPWIISQQATEMILEREGVDRKEEVAYTDPVNEWPDELAVGERPSVERATELITEKDHDPEPEFGFGFGLAPA